MSVRVVITGLGCVSPLGNSVPATWQAAIAGRSGAGPITHFDPAQLDTRFAAEVKGFDAAELFGRKEARRMDRFTQFGVAATQEALNDAGLTITDSNRDRVGVFIGSGIGGIGTIMTETEVMLTKGRSASARFSCR